MDGHSRELGRGALLMVSQPPLPESGIRAELQDPGPQVRLHGAGSFAGAWRSEETGGASV